MPRSRLQPRLRVRCLLRRRRPPSNNTDTSPPPRAIADRDRDRLGLWLRRRRCGSPPGGGNRKCFFRDGEADLSTRLPEELRDEKAEDSPDRATREVARCGLRPRKVAESPDSVLAVVVMAKGTGVRRLLRPRCASGSGVKVTLLANGSSAKPNSSFSPVIVPRDVRRLVLDHVAP